MRAPNRLLRLRERFLRARLRGHCRRLHAGPGKLGAGERGLFVDCGSNLGQGFEQFQPHFPAGRFDYVMIEPNPHCAAQLRANLLADTELDITLIEAAASDGDDVTRFYGLVEDGRGECSQGGSISDVHNSAMYAVDEARAIEVETFDFARFLEEQSSRYPVIALKIDIEGAEYAVLEHLIATDATRFVTFCLVEFHSRYMSGAARGEHKRHEARLKRVLGGRIPIFGEWV